MVPFFELLSFFDRFPLMAQDFKTQDRVPAVSISATMLFFFSHPTKPEKTRIVFSPDGASERSLSCF